MKIAYYMPFKTMGHPHPSGDLVTGTEIFSYLSGIGHECKIVSKLRSRWLYLRPWQWLQLYIERRRVLKSCRRFSPDIWLSYHTYYKAPDLLGPFCARKLGIPYVIFQGIYSTKRRKQLKTMPGFYLNRHALTSADLVFTNKRRDEHNLRRLLPDDHIHYIAPGLHTEDFSFDPEARERLRNRWQTGDATVIMTAAMFRSGVKTTGVKKVIEACGELARQGRKLKLVIAGDGKCRQELVQLARNCLPTDTIFCGLIARKELHTLYSGADIFAFPGIEESLGMVYLEAQSCNLPVVAYRDWGGSEAVVHGQTGLLSAADKPRIFVKNIDRLICDFDLRRKLACQAGKHVRQHHDLDRVYTQLGEKLALLATQQY